MVTTETESTSPLLFFDTGMGGLSVLGESQKLLPTAPIVYAADYAGLPYGMKSEDELAARIPTLLGRLTERYRPQLITIACNTASTVALDYVRSALDVPVVGTVPAIKPASAMTESRVIGLLGTKATIRQPYIDRLASEFAADKQLIRFAAPELVYAAEAKLRGEKPDLGVVKDSMEGLISQPGGDKMDVVILACTHFPLVQEELRMAINRRVRFIHGAAGIAKRIQNLTEDTRWPEKSSGGIFVTTGSRDQITPYIPTLKDYDIDRIDVL